MLTATSEGLGLRPLGVICIPICTCDRAPRWALSFVSSHRSFVSPTCPATARGTSRPPYGSMPPPSPPLPPDLRDELETVCQSLEGLQRARYLAIASLCCAVYDYSLTLDQEVRPSPRDGASVFKLIVYTGGILLDGTLDAFKGFILYRK